MDNETIRQHFDAEWSRRKTVERVWELLEQYVIPYSGRFFEDRYSEHQVDWYNPQLYDSTAIIANSILASSMQTALTNPAIKWFNLIYSNHKMNMDLKAMEWLQEAEDRMGGAIASSNFSLEASQFYLDLTGFGTSAMALEINVDTEDFLFFNTIPIKELYFVEDWRGRPEMVMREYMWTPVQIISKFGKENVPEDVRQRAEGTETSKEKMKVVFCIFKRQNKANADGHLRPRQHQSVSLSQRRGEDTVAYYRVGKPG